MKAIEVAFGEVVRKYREKSGLSQEEFAAVAGVHRTYISSIELGKVQISIAVAEKMSAALGIPLSRIFRDVERLRDNPAS